MNKRLFKFSVGDFLLLSLFSLILYVVLIYIMSLMMGKPFLSFIEKQWIIFVIYVLIMPITQASINRKGELMITDSEYLSKCNNHLDEIIISKGYISIRKSDNETIYTKKTKIARVFNFFLSEDIVICNELGVIRILSKRNVLIQLENKIKKLVD